MYGYFEDHANVVACAAALQDYIDKMFPGSDSGRSGRDSDVPEVSVSFSEFGAIIEASELQVWHSAQGQGDMTPENVIASFRARCDYWAVFGTLATPPVPPKPVVQVAGRTCADCGKIFIEQHEPWPIRPSCINCNVGA